MIAHRDKRENPSAARTLAAITAAVLGSAVGSFALGYLGTAALVVTL